MPHRYGTVSAALLAILIANPAPAERRQRQEKPDEPRVLMALPLAVAAGGEAKVTLRGRKLDNASAVRLIGVEPATAAEIRGKGKAEVPNPQKADRIGDTQLEIAFALPASVPDGRVSLVVTTPDGETQPYELRVEPAGGLADEKEPNDAFERPQELPAGQVLCGMIQNAKDADVYRFAATAGQALLLEVDSARRGSASDPMLMVFDAEGRLMATADDAEPGRDPLIEFVVPRDGAYLVTVLDANDGGGPAHPYLLTVRAKP